MEKPTQIFEEISINCHSYVTFYKFNRSIKESIKYRDGRIDAANWINELVYYYLQKEKNFIKEFSSHIQEQKGRIAVLKDGDYKQGLFDQLDNVENYINRKVNHK